MEHMAMRSTTSTFCKKTTSHVFTKNLKKNNSENKPEQQQQQTKLYNEKELLPYLDFFDLGLREVELIIEKFSPHALLFP
jgi:hypothetical protein